MMAMFWRQMAAVVTLVLAIHMIAWAIATPGFQPVVSAGGGFLLATAVSLLTWDRRL